MTTVALLIRHGDTDVIGRRLVGRLPGVHLNAHGRHQAARLSRLARAVRLDAVYSSPLERARETASAVARAASLAVRIDEDLNEIDFGEWTGLTFEALNARQDWRRFNEARSSAEVPGGESATCVQERIMSALETLRARHTGRTFAVISHCDVIRAAVLFVTGTSLDHFYRVEIAPATITAIDLEPPPRTLYVNVEIDAVAAPVT